MARMSVIWMNVKDPRLPWSCLRPQHSSSAGNVYDTAELCCASRELYVISFPGLVYGVCSLLPVAEEMGAQGLHYLCALRGRAVPWLLGPREKEPCLCGRSTGRTVGPQHMLTSSCDFRPIWNLKAVGTSSLGQGHSKCGPSGGWGSGRTLWFGEAPTRSREDSLGGQGAKPRKLHEARWPPGGSTTHRMGLLGSRWDLTPWL